MAHNSYLPFATRVKDVFIPRLSLNFLHLPILLTVYNNFYYLRNFFAVYGTFSCSEDNFATYSIDYSIEYML